MYISTNDKRTKTNEFYFLTLKRLQEVPSGNLEQGFFHFNAETFHISGTTISRQRKSKNVNGVQLSIFLSASSLLTLLFYFYSSFLNLVMKLNMEKTTDDLLLTVY